MKKMYFLKSLPIAAALLCAGSLFAQTAKEVVFEEVPTPAYVEQGATTGEKENLPWTFRNCASWGDYNNDGNLDLLLMGFGQNMVRINYLYRNNGDGTFTKILPAEVPNNQTSPFGWMDNCCAVWFDFNNDGNLDLFLSGVDDQGAFTTVFKNLGGPDYEFEMVFDTEFEYVGTSQEGRTQRFAAAGDYDNDGWVDIFTIGDGGSGRVANLYRNLQGTGFEKVEFPVNGTDAMIGVSGSSVAWGDWNKDGYLDILAMGYSSDHDATYYPNPCSIYTNNGDGTFSVAYIRGGEKGETAWWDFNNDGFLDIVVTGEGYHPDGGGFYWFSGSVYENDGQGDYSLIIEDYTGIPGSGDGVSVAAGDVNNDGYEDLLWQGTYHHTSVFLNNYGGGEFNRYLLQYKRFSEETQQEELVDVDCTKGVASMVDFDNDGYLDAFSSGWQGGGLNAAYIMKNTGKDLDGNAISANEKPSVPTNLKAEKEGDITTFSWDASTDDTTPEEVIKYNLYVKEGDLIKAVLPVNLTTGRLKVNDLLAPINTTSYKLSGLGSSYTWGVQAIDNSKATSAFATAQVGSDGIDSSVAVKTPKSVQYFDLTGKVVDSTTKGVVIKKTTYDDGSVENRKVVK